MPLRLFWNFLNSVLSKSFRLENNINTNSLKFFRFKIRFFNFWFFEKFCFFLYSRPGRSLVIWNICKFSSTRLVPACCLSVARRIKLNIFFALFLISDLSARLNGYGKLWEKLNFFRVTHSMPETNKRCPTDFNIHNLNKILQIFLVFFTKSLPIQRRCDRNLRSGKV